MQWLRDLSVSRKLFYAFGIVCGLCIALGTYTVVTFHTVSSHSADVSENAFPSTIDISRAASAMNVVRRMDLDLLLCQAPECITSHVAERQKAIDAFQAAIKDYEPLVSYEGERPLYQKLTGDFARYLEVSNKGVAQLQGGNAGEALDLLSSDNIVSIFKSATDAANDALSMNAKDGMKSATSATSSASAT